jgi:hypothetical protein
MDQEELVRHTGKLHTSSLVIACWCAGSTQPATHSHQLSHRKVELSLTAYTTQHTSFSTLISPQPKIPTEPTMVMEAWSSSIWPSRRRAGKPEPDQGGEEQASQNLTKEEKSRQAKNWPRRRRAGNQSSLHFINKKHKQQIIYHTTSAIFNQQVDFLANNTSKSCWHVVCMHGWLGNRFSSVLQGGALQNHHWAVNSERHQDP